MKNKPVAILISDIHYNLNSLQLADAALNIAINKANELKVGLIIAGDMHDSKANIRAECVNAIRKTLSRYNVEPLKPIILVGNHCKINEKSAPEEHALNFCEDLADIYEHPMFTNTIAVNRMSLWLVPYQHDKENFKNIFKRINKGSCIIMHQGLNGTEAGEYIQDKSALRPEDVAGFRVISGHYHRRQTIALPDGGKWDYIGSPYTMNYGEANDPPKGFQVLYSDGSLEFIPTNLRKHIVIEAEFTEDASLTFMNYPEKSSEDLIWLKVKGSKEELALYSKEQWKKAAMIQQDFRLDLIPTDSVSQVNATQNLTKPELMDSLIDSLSNTSDECKIRLKNIWKDMM